MFRFTIRDVLWITVVVALATAWWLDGRAKGQRLAEQQDLIATFRRDWLAITGTQPNFSGRNR